MKLMTWLRECGLDMSIYDYNDAIVYRSGYVPRCELPKSDRPCVCLSMSKPKTKKAQRRAKAFLLQLTGKKFRRGFAQRLTGQGHGLVRWQDVHIAKPSW